MGVPTKPCLVEVHSLQDYAASASAWNSSFLSGIANTPGELLQSASLTANAVESDSKASVDERPAEISGSGVDSGAPREEGGLDDGLLRSGLLSSGCVPDQSPLDGAKAVGGAGEWSEADYQLLKLIMMECVKMGTRYASSDSEIYSEVSLQPDQNSDPNPPARPSDSAHSDPDLYIKPDLDNQVNFLFIYPITYVRAQNHVNT